ncbi:uncharacterized protein LOC120265640 [Dioscorea cayenensis subsp. rotundata]|uniref:Uncharacterized protein LOC120265640 n=1 Tax=Dioscorea cayennensis subsp. rotundata TaxID=55577 RepID=A0AB40BSD5_DIOCR|nr:uncharacterized protein LOC120265640 [Dioscorea cayenensis subsp. rotundata]
MRGKMKPLLHLFLFLLFISLILTQGCVALRNNEYSQMVLQKEIMRKEMMMYDDDDDEKFVKKRMDFETHDYPGSGANNRHDPRGPGRD